MDAWDRAERSRRDFLAKEAATESLTDVTRFVTTADEKAAFDVFPAETALQSAAWDPVVRRLGVLLVEAQEDPVAAATVHQRMRTLAGFRMTGAQFDAATLEARHATGLLSELLRLQASPTAPEKTSRRPSRQAGR
ncbi:MAG: hypothetical protein ABI140_01890 [Jatrophihabitantaceae bacterium]